jgi:CMP-N-acetylneuraminic acid synthetase
MMKVVALVPMRHDSERVPGKNRRLLGGLPLFHHILRTLEAAQSVGRIVVDSDSSEIEAGLTPDFPRVEFLQRPAELLGGDVPMNEIILHDLSVLDGDFFLQTHSTNPFLRAESVDAAVTAFEAAYPERDSLFSVTRIQRRLWSEAGEAVNHDPAVLLPTQELPPLFEENSCLYLFAREVMESRRNRIGERPLLWELESREAFDIDVESEFELAELLLQAGAAAPAT